MVDALDLEIEALGVLDSAQNYEEGVNALKSIYQSTVPTDSQTPQLTSVLADYGDKLFYKFKQPVEDPSDLLQIAPIKVADVAGETTTDKINNWETANLEYLNQSPDLDHTIYSKPLARQIKAFASDARREENTQDGGVWGEIVDKGARLVEGAVGPIASIGGYDEVGTFFREYTRPQNDETLASALTSSAGAIIPALIAEAATVGGSTPVLLAQTFGATRAAYNRYIQATGDKEKAEEGAALTFAGQAIGFIPVGRAASGLLKTGETAAQKLSQEGLAGVLENLKPMGVLKTALKTGAEGAVGGAAGQVLGNVGESIGTDTPLEINAGVANAAISNAILSGGVGGVHALINDVSLHQFKQTLKEAEAVHNGTKTKPPTPGKEIVEGVTADVDLVERPFDIQQQKQQAEEAALNDLYPFTRDDDGHFVIRDSNADADAEQLRKIQSEIPAEESTVDTLLHATDESGAEIPIPHAPDEVVATPDEFFAKPDSDGQLSIAGKVLVSDVPNAIKPNRFSTWFAQRLLGSNISLQRNVANGAFGAFFTKDHSIKILRSLGADPQKLSETLAHEIGHLVDAYTNNAFTTKGLRQLGQKLTGLKDVTDNIAGNLITDARALSAEWRPGWNGEPGRARGTPFEQFQYYRSRPEEVYADVFSAVLNAPDWVREKYPSIIEAVEKHLSTHPDTAEAWKTFQSFEVDPFKVSEFDSNMRREHRARQGEIAKEAVASKRRTVGQKLKAHRDQAYQFFFDRYAPAKEAFTRLSDVAKSTGYDMLNNLTRKDYVGHFIKRIIDEPLKNVMTKVESAGIDLNDWAQYEWANRVINETTPTIEKVKENPQLYRAIAGIFREFLSNEKGVNQDMVNRIFDPERLLDTDSLIQAFASVHLIGDTSRPISLQDFEGKYPLTDPNRQQKMQAAYRRAIKSLASRDISIPVENLKEYISKFPDKNARTLLEEVTTPGAFSVRKYLVNQGGTTIFDAHRDVDYLKHKLGAEKFNYLQEQSTSYHTILAQALPTIKEAGILTPEMYQRLVVNKDNYVTATVLKYFEGDDSIDSSIHQSIGSLSDIGNELNSTSLKMKAFIERSYYQRAVNAAVALADATGDVVEVTKPTWGKSIFDEKRKLSAQDKDHSYLIGYTEGKPALYKIAGGKSFENMFKTQRDLPGVGFLLDLSDKFNSLFLTRQLKTSLSPSFILNQKLMDRKWETMLANSLGVTKGVPINFGLSRHSSSKLRAFDTKSISELRHFKETGEITGNLKKLLDLDGAALELHQGDPGTIPYETSFEHAIYEAFGTDVNEVPEAKSAVGKAVQQTEAGVKAIGNYLENNKFSKALSDIANFDELRTKINGFQIGKAAGMTDSQAAAFARERFGNPDPLAGGTAAPLLSRMFLFGRAHLNGLRNLKDLLKDNPKSAALNAALLMAPKLMGATAIMVPVIRSIYGDDSADKYQKMIDMIPENEWITKGIIPLGFQDDQGNIRMFHDVKASEIGPDWKAFYTRTPQTHEFTAMSRVLWPTFKELYQGNVASAGSGAFKGAETTVAANVQPLYRYVEGLFTLIEGGNPIDSFRQKPILSKEVAAGGTPLQKAGEYGAYLGSQQFGSVIPYNPFRTTNPKGALETTIQKAPIVGPMLRSLVGVSNYGNVEKDKAIQADRDQEVARIRLSVDDVTSDLLDQYTIAKAQTLAIGKGWQSKMPEEKAKQIAALTSWHTKVWTYYKNELLAARQAGDSERYNVLLNSLEKYSKQIKPQIVSEKLTLEDNTEKKGSDRK